mgnify:CR=1 FL=1|jgi:hypothetical protein
MYVRYSTTHGESTTNRKRYYCVVIAYETGIVGYRAVVPYVPAVSGTISDVYQYTFPTNSTQMYKNTYVQNQ